LIFDEIQSYKNSIWKEIITFLNHYSKILNIKIIIMSATLPNLCKLSNTDIDYVDLILDTDKFYQNSIFKNRVKPDYSLMKYKENVEEELLNHVLETSKIEDVNILIEFITKRSAKQFYESLKKLDINKTKMLLTGEDSSYERNRIVEKFKKDKNIILVATQIIEAGIDLDADVGYKDISMIDSEEQFAGRINRNFKNIDNQGIMYFFKLDDASVIYKGDVRKEKSYTLENEYMRKLYEDKNFKEYYEKIMNYLNKEDNEFEKFFEKSVNTLNFKGIEKHMNLIDENYEYSIFFNRTLKISEDKTLIGEKVWDKYVELLEDKEFDYSQKRVRLFNASTDMSHFTYKVKYTGFAYEKRIGDLFYIHDGEKYFEDGKFNRQAFDGELFL
jgi:CRISPR-associated endonuclease/helicase Cas3